MTLVLVGEAPGREVGVLPDHLALAGGSGRRLASIAGVDWSVYLRRTERVNLFDRYQSRWSRSEAYAAAFRLVPRLIGRRAILAGRRVAEAFGVPTEPPAQWRWLDLTAVGDGWLVRYATIPHPSGRNRRYNSADVRERVGSFVRSAIEEAV